MANARQVYLMVGLVMALAVSLVAYGAWDSIRAEDAEERQIAEAGDRGAHLFATYCRVCHGRGGEGGVGPPLNQEFRTDQMQDFQPDDPIRLEEVQRFVTNTIRCGRAGTLMPSWHIDQGGALNDEQIRQLVVLITLNPTVPPTGFESPLDRGREPAWERAKAEADHADETGWHVDQERPVSPQDTRIAVSNVEGRAFPDDFPFDQGDIFRMDAELLEVVRLDGNTSTVEVRRGVRGTQAAEHSAHAAILLPPIDPPTTVPEPACGQVIRRAPAQPSPTTTPASGVQAQTSWEVIATDNAFDKTQLVVPAGQEFTITMVNRGQAPHNVHIFESQGGPSIAATDPILITGGQSGTLRTTIGRPGSYYYQCDYHPAEMTGTLVVQ